MNFKFVIKTGMDLTGEEVLVSTENTSFTKTFDNTGESEAIIRFEEKLNNLESKDGLYKVFEKLGLEDGQTKNISISIIDEDSTLYKIAEVSITSNEQVKYFGDFAPIIPDEKNTEKFMFERVLELK